MYPHQPWLPARMSKRVNIHHSGAGRIEGSRSACGPPALALLGFCSLRCLCTPAACNSSLHGLSDYHVTKIGVRLLDVRACLGMRDSVSTRPVSFEPRIQSPYAQECCCRFTYIYLLPHCSFLSINSVSSFVHQFEHKPLLHIHVSSTQKLTG